MGVRFGQFNDQFGAMPEATEASRAPLADRFVYKGAQPSQAAPPAMSQGALDATGAGITGASQAMQQILAALARSQALENDKMNANADRNTQSRVIESRIREGGRDADSKRHLGGLSNLLEMMRQAQDLRANGTALQQQATSGMTQGMVRRGTNGKS